MARKSTLKFPPRYKGSFTPEQQRLLHEAMQTGDIQSIPNALAARARQAFKNMDAADRRALPAHNWDVHTRSLRGLRRDFC